MSPGLGAALTGLAWAGALGLPILAMALILAFGGDEPSAQLLGLAVLGMLVGAFVAAQASIRIRVRVDQTRAEVMARLRHARTPDEARFAVRAAAVFAGDPAYAEHAANLPDDEVVALCEEIASRNDVVAQVGPHRQPRQRSGSPGRERDPRASIRGTVGPPD